MRKNLLCALVLAFSTLLTAQKPAVPAVKSDFQNSLEARLKTVRAELAFITAALEDTTKTMRFTPSLLDSVYLMQGDVESLTYVLYERTDYPITEDSTALSDLGDDSDSDSLETPSMPPGFPGGMSDNPFSRFGKKKSPRTIFRFGYSRGVSDLVESGSRAAAVVYPTFDYDRSGMQSFQFMLETRLGERDTLGFYIGGGFNPKKPWKREDQFKNSRLSLRWGISLDRYIINEIGDHELTTENNQPVFKPLASAARENDLFVRCISVPVVLQMKVAKSTIVQAGLFAGVRTKGQQRVVYRDGEFDFERTRTDNFEMAKFNYGLLASIGWEGLYLTGRFHLNPFFNNNDTYDYRLFSYGLTLSL